MRLAPIAPSSAAFEDFEALLDKAGLPRGDLKDEPAAYYALGDTAFGGLLILGEGDALIRSVVVAERARSAGLGKAMVEGLVELAFARGARRLWLLTETADRFFARLGWQAVGREVAPAAVAGSRQFAVTCPDSAVLMCRTRA